MANGADQESTVRFGLKRMIGALMLLGLVLAVPLVNLWLVYGAITLLMLLVPLVTIQFVVLVLIRRWSVGRGGSE